MLYHGLVQRAVTRLVGFVRPAGFADLRASIF